MLQKIIPPLVALLVVFLAWEMVSYTYESFLFILPAPSKIFLCFWRHGGRFWYHTLVTVKEMAGGFFLAFLLAFPMAWVMTLWTSTRAILQPLFVVIQCIPMFTLAPIMILWFDWSYTAIVIPVALMIFFPLTMNIYQGLRSTPKHLVDYFRMNEATTWQLFSKLQLPWALPNIFSGIRISTAIAGIGAVAGEWAGGQEGLGLLMLESRRGADLETTFAGLFCLTLLSMGLYITMILLEKRVTTRGPGGVRWGQVATTAMAFLFGIILLGCHQPNASKKEVRMTLDWLPNPNHIPLYTGVDKRIFDKHGIHLLIRKIPDPGNAIAYLTSGQTELSIGYVPQTLRAIAKGAQVKPVAILVKESLNSVIFRKGLGVEKPSDLSGKVIGYCIDGFQTKYLDTLMKLSDIVPAEKKNVSFDVISTLGRGKIDAIFGVYWNIEGEQYRSLGIDTGYFKVSELGVPEHDELIVLAREQIPDAIVTHFREALQESIDFSREHPEEAFDCYLRANPDKRGKAHQWEREAWRKTIPAFADNQEIDPKRWDHFQKWLVENHML